MKMKRSCYVIVGVVLLAVCAALCLCCRKSSADLSAAIPKDAALVARIDLKSLLADDGLKLEDLRSSSLSIEDFGIDFSKTAYGFMYQGYFGAVVPLKSKDDLFNRTMLLHNRVESQRGLDWTTYGGSFLVVADSKKAIVVGPATTSEQDALRNVLYTCMTQKGSDGGNMMLEYLNKRSEPLAFAANLAVISERRLNMIKPIFPSNVALGDYVASGGLTAKGNEITMSMALTCDNEDAQAFLNGINNTLRPMKASLYETAPANSFLHIEMGIDGEKLIELLRQTPETRTRMLAANMVFDLDMILRSVDGDVSLTMPELVLFNPQLIVQADVADTKFMENVPSWNEGVTQQTGICFSPFRDGWYQFTYNYDTYYFGVNDRKLRIANREKYAECPSVGMTAPADAGGNRVYITIDLSSVADLMSFLPFNNSLSSLRKLSLRCGDVSEWTLTLTADEGIDILKYLLSQ